MATFNILGNPFTILATALTALNTYKIIFSFSTFDNVKVDYDTLLLCIANQQSNNKVI